MANTRFRKIGFRRTFDGDQIACRMKPSDCSPLLAGPNFRLVGNPSLRPLTLVLNVNAERHRDEDHLRHRAGNRRVMFENPNIIVSVYAPSRISYCKC
jgi:hypothetical protein